MEIESHSVDGGNKNFNIAEFLPRMAASNPFQKAVIFPGDRDRHGRRSYTHFTFKQLDAECDRYAFGMTRAGICKGTRVLLMVKPSLEFIALTFALFKTGAVPILIDPGMGRKRLLECIGDVSPEAVVGIPLVHLVRQFFRRPFRSSRINLVVGGKAPFLARDLEKLSPPITKPFTIADTTRSSTAAILFTTGSTGPAKGVIYEHGMFGAQVTLLRETYQFQPGEVDLAGLPVFALFDVALGMTCVVPDMDPTRPAQVNPLNIVEAIQDHGVTNSFGSPAIWKQVVPYCRQNGIRLPSVKRILMSGAPVPGDLIRDFKGVLPNGDIYTPFGATESLPVTSISGEEIVNQTYPLSREGFGTCVGRAVPGVTLKIMAITDEPVSEWLNSLELGPNKVGEIVVKGPMVTRAYDNREKATAEAKIRQGEETWHRMGDVGYLDSGGRLWFCGRKGHRVMTASGPLYTVPCEAIFNRHPAVFRSALVGVGKWGKQVPVIVIEPHPERFPEAEDAKNNLSRELLHLASAYPHTSDFRYVLFHRSFPVDIRHNAKIFRQKLAIWAEKRILV